MRHAATLALIGLLGCEGTIDRIVPIRVVTDGGTAADASTSDGGARDGGVDDAPDGGARDGGTPDSGLDGGTRDGGPRDGGLPTSLGPCATSVWGAILAILDAAPRRESEDYVPLPANGRAPLKDAVREALAGDEAALIAALDPTGYTACRPAPGLVMFEPAAGTGRALAVVRAGAARRAIVSAPHAIYEIDTASVAMRLFDDLEGLALVVSGTHRCANARASGCSGETTACSAQSMPYVESDMAHNVVSAFHLFHETLLDEVATSTTVSLHGKGGNGAVLSNGTMDDTTEDALVARAVRALAVERPADAVLTCNRFPGGQIAGQLCGTTNVQGRHANGSPRACTVDPTAANDRFLHLELPLSIRSDPGAVSAAVAAALR